LQERLAKLIGRFKNSMALELQQRSVEYLVLLGEEWSGLRPDVLQQMPVLDIEALRERQVVVGCKRAVERERPCGSGR
jgi:hypothetical protein